MTLHKRSTFILSANRALIGAITSNMRGIALQCEKDPVKLRFYFKEVPTEEEQDLMNDITGEMLGDFPDLPDIQAEVIVTKDDITELDPLDEWIMKKYK